MRSCFAVKACGWSGLAGSSGRWDAHQGMSAGRDTCKVAFIQATVGAEPETAPPSHLRWAHLEAMGPCVPPSGRLAPTRGPGTEGLHGLRSGVPAPRPLSLQFSSENTLSLTKRSPFSLENSTVCSHVARGSSGCGMPGGGEASGTSSQAQSCSHGRGRRPSRLLGKLGLTSGSLMPPSLWGWEGGL